MPTCSQLSKRKRQHASHGRQERRLRQKRQKTPPTTSREQSQPRREGGRRSQPTHMPQRVSTIAAKHQQSSRQRMSTITAKRQQVSRQRMSTITAKRQQVSRQRMWTITAKRQQVSQQRVSTITAKRQQVSQQKHQLQITLYQLKALAKPQIVPHHLLLPVETRPQMAQWYSHHRRMAASNLHHRRPSHCPHARHSSYTTS